MNGAHLHMLLNHVSLFSLLIGTVVFAVSMKRKSVELRTVASALFLITGLFAWIAVETGESAADLVKTLDAGSESLIHTHALAAEWALRSGITIAVVAVAMEWAARKKKKAFKPLQWVLLVLAIHGSTVFVVTAGHGGKIRHTEIRS